MPRRSESIREFISHRLLMGSGRYIFLTLPSPTPFLSLSLYLFCLSLFLSVSLPPLASAFCTSRSFQRFSCAEPVDKFKGKLKVATPLRYPRAGIRTWRRIPSSTSIANDRRTKDETGTSSVGRIAQADYTFSFVIKHGGSQRENNVSLITRLDSTRYSLLSLSATPLSRCVSLYRDITSRVLSTRDFVEMGIKTMFARKPKALPTLSFELRRITFPFISRARL